MRDQGNVDLPVREMMALQQDSPEMCYELAHGKEAT
jgi:hypothetical protein